MSDTTTQPTAAPNSGASNASEFQPTTQNPQDVSSNLYQQQTGIQNVKNTQEVLNDQKNARISITYQPSGQNMPVAKAHETPVIFIFSLICGTLIVLLIIGRKYGFGLRKLSKPSDPQALPPQAQVETEIAATDTPASKPTEVATAKPKKPTQKKTKRRHR